jgi:WD40 repeat protein
MNYQCRLTLAGHRTSVRALELSPYRLVSGSTDEVRMWDASTGCCTGRISLHDPTFSLTFDATHLFIGSGSLRVFDFSEKASSRTRKNFLRKIF